MPNSPPLSGKNARTAEAPVNPKIVVRINEPHTAQPTPNMPLIIPTIPPPATRFLCDASTTRLRKKYTSNATYTPKRIAIVIVYEAEKSEKLVLIEPSKLRARCSFSMIVAPDWKNDHNRRKFGSHTKNTNTAALMQSASVVYAGRFRTFMSACNSIIIFLAELVQ